MLCTSIMIRDMCINDRRLYTKMTQNESIILLISSCFVRRLQSVILPMSSDLLLLLKNNMASVDSYYYFMEKGLLKYRLASRNKTYRDRYLLEAIAL